MDFKNKSARQKQPTQQPARSRGSATDVKLDTKLTRRKPAIETLPDQHLPVGAPRTQAEARARIMARVRADQVALDALAEL